MKRIFSLFMALCLLFCGVLPAYAAESVAGSTAVVDSSNATPSEAVPPEGSAPKSDFTGGGTEFYTKIRLTVTDRNGNPIAGVVYGLYSSADDRLIETLTTDENGVATSGDVPMETDYYVEEISAPEGFQPNVGQHEIKLTDVCAPSRIDITAKYDPITGQIQVIKTDEDGNLLEGVGFTVYRYSDWSWVDDITTDATGTATTTSLPYGQYVFSEYNIPEGLAADSYYYATIGEQDVTVELEIVNYAAKGDVKITKTGNDGRKISGAVFEIFSADTNDLVQEVTTNSSGYVWSSYMPLGDYYAVEKSVPAPYKLDTTRHDFSLTYNYQSVYLNLENVVDGDSGRVKIIKTDDSDNPLSGVVFGLYRSWDGKKLGELTTGADGTALSGELIPGDYYLLEQTGKPGYTPVTGQIAFTIDGSGTTVEQMVVNPKIRVFGKVKVIKQDDAGSPIPGVKFGLYCDKGNLLEELTTGADGTATSGVLNEGGYYLVELEGAAGYLTDDAQHPFSITTDESVVPVTVTNPRITGGVKVIKTGTDGEALWDVVFGIYEADTDREVCRMETDWNGEAESDPLYYGDYYLKELETQDGYELIDTPIPFSISEQDVVLELSVTNPFILGGVEIYKWSGEEPMPQEMPNNDKAGEDRILLPGAVFGIYTEWGQKLAEITTDADGHAEYFGLPKGAYYLKELTAPEGYTLIDQLIPFSIDYQGEVFEAQAFNPEGFGTIQVLKSGEDGALPGVTFDVYRTSSEEKVGSLVTDAQGLASLELPLGHYYLVETATAPGYALLSGKASFTLTEDDATVELPILNQKESCKPEGGHIRLLKRDADNSDTLTGAIFGIYHADTARYAGEIATGSDGTATSLMLPAGDYYIVELCAPEGYETDPTRHPVTVTTGGIAEITVTNKRLPEQEPEKPQPPVTPEQPTKPGTIRIIKVDAESGKKLAGAVFGVYNADSDKQIDTLITDKSGAAELSLPAGDYYIREQEAPKGYILKKTDINFHLESGATRELTVNNTPEDEPEKMGILELTKEDRESGKVLRNAVFAVYTKDNEKIDEVTTGRDGIAELELSVGSYYLREVVAPRGYQLDRSKVSFKITADKTTRLIVENTKEKSDPVKPETPKPEQPIPETAKPEQPKPTPSQPETPKPAPSQPGTSKPNPSKPGTTEPSGKVRLVKLAAGSGVPLPGAVFGVYAQSSEKLSEIISGADGAATLSLPVGRYYLKEQRAPLRLQARNRTDSCRCDPE